MAVLDDAFPLMTTENGYNFDYATANILDPASWPSGQAVPSYAFGEDGRNLAHRVVGFNTFDTPLRFRVLPPLQAGVAPQELASRALDDIDRMIAAKSEALRSAGALFLSAPMRPAPVGRLRQARPVEAAIEYLLTWRQGYTNPVA
jgi:hypothetical protein